MPEEAVAGRDEPNSRDLIQSIEKGLAVIRVFSGKRRRCTLADVARETGISRAAARRILLTLQALGYVGISGREYYLLPRVLDLGYNVISSAGLTGLVQPHLDALNKDIAEDCSLGVMVQGEVVFVAHAQSRRLLAASLYASKRFDAFVTAVGRVLLAGLDDAEVARVLSERPPRTYTRYTVTEPDLLMAEVRRAREQGWSVVAEELEIGFCSAAVPIRIPDGTAVAALNVGSHSSRMTPQQAATVIVPKLQAAASVIEQELMLHPQPF